MEPENQEIYRLQRKRDELQRQADECDRLIGQLQRACSHERDSWPDAWWCRKCGGEIKATSSR